MLLALNFKGFLNLQNGGSASRNLHTFQNLPNREANFQLSSSATETSFQEFTNMLFIELYNGYLSSSETLHDGWEIDAILVLRMDSDKLMHSLTDLQHSYRDLQTSPMILTCSK